MAASSSPAAHAGDVPQRVLLVPYPKVVFLYPTFLAAIGAAVCKEINDILDQRAPPFGPTPPSFGPSKARPTWSPSRTRLTMIPDRFAAIENAFAMLKPGGVVGVADFYVSRRHPAQGSTRHSWLTRWFWPAWFAGDDVFLSADHLPFLRRHFDEVSCIEGTSKLL